MEGGPDSDAYSQRSRHFLVASFKDISAINAAEPHYKSLRW